MTAENGVRKQEILVGTLNPAKLAGCERAVIAIKRPKHFRLSGCEVLSKVSDMPVGERTCLSGARQRALGCRAHHADAELYVGIESGLRLMPEKVLAMTTYAYVLHRSGAHSFANSSSHPVAVAPPRGSRRGPVYPVSPSGHESIRDLTNGAYTLSDKVFEAVLCALATLYQKIDAGRG